MYSVYNINSINIYAAQYIDYIVSLVIILNNSRPYSLIYAISIVDKYVNVRCI